MSDSKPIGFKEHILPHVVDEERVLLLTEAGGKVLLRGKLYAQVAPLLDGSRNMDEIVDALKPDTPPAEAYFALMKLEKKGYIAPTAEGMDPMRAAFWYGLGASLEEATKRIRQSSVAVVSIGNTSGDAAALSAALAALEIPAAGQGEASLAVAVVEDYLQTGLAEMNKRMRETGKPWMPVKAVGQVLWLGPVFGEGGGACWACLARRLKENRPEEMIAQGSQEDHPVLSRGALPTTRAAAANHAATEIAKWAALGGHKVLKDSVLTIDLKALETRAHKVQKLPDCEVCGEPMKEGPASAERARIFLKNRPKRFTADGGHRVCRPEETLKTLEPLISPITGIIPDLFKRIDSDEVHVYSVKQVSPLAPDFRNNARLGHRSNAAGKGASDIQAKVSCLAEAVERYNLHSRGNEPRFRARLGDLGEDAIHPHVLLNFSKRQYASREEWNEENQEFNWVPMPFDETKEVAWSPNWSLTREEIRWLPAFYCYFMPEVDEDHLFCRSDSNGCASGNNLEEAILHGFLELVERDSMALWWYNRVRRPSIDLDSFNDPFLHQMVHFHRRQGRTLVVLDITSDLGIPAAIALSWDEDGGSILIGSGAHLDARLAVSRAVTEANQMMPWLKAKGKTPQSVSQQRESNRQIIRWLREATVENQPYVLPTEGEMKTAADFPRLHTNDLLKDIRICVDILRNRGMEVIVLDLTRPDVDFSTVSVSVPGLRHFWARFAPGRLYDVPVEMGWLDRKLDESDMNPIPFFS